MTFSVPRLNVVESDTGYSVEVIPRHAPVVRYVEGDLMLDISGEWLVGPVPLVLYRKQTAADVGFIQRLAISPTELERIVENIRAAIRYTGYEIDVL